MKHVWNIYGVFFLGLFVVLLWKLWRTTGSVSTFTFTCRLPDVSHKLRTKTGFVIKPVHTKNNNNITKKKSRKIKSLDIFFWDISSLFFWGVLFYPHVAPHVYVVQIQRRRNSIDPFIRGTHSKTSTHTPRTWSHIHTHISIMYTNTYVHTRAPLYYWQCWKKNYREKKVLLNFSSEK